MTKLLLAAVVLAGCYTTRTPPDPQAQLERETNTRLGELRAQNASLDPILNDSFAFAVFPDIGQPQGLLYEHGIPSGFVSLRQTSGEGYTEVLVLRDEVQVALLKAGRLDLIDPQVVFIHGRNPIEVPGPGTVALIAGHRGARMPVTVAGQQLMFEPRG